MYSFPIVENLNPLKNGTFSLVHILKDSAVYELSFEGIEKSLHWRIVPAVSTSAHALNHTERFYQPAIVITCILAPAIRVKQYSFFGPLAPICRHECFRYKLNTHMVVHRKANDFATMTVDNRGQICPTLFKPQIGNV